jgi:glycerophosphoryl diester phosphodiesterase
MHSQVVADSDPLFYDESGAPTTDPAAMVGRVVTERAQKAGLLFWTYGNANSHPDKVQLQRNWGCDAVICDNIDKIVQADKRKHLANTSN